LNKDGDYSWTYLFNGNSNAGLLYDNRHRESAFSVSNNDFSNGD